MKRQLMKFLFLLVGVIGPAVGYGQVKPIVTQRQKVGDKYHFSPCRGVTYIQDEDYNRLSEVDSFPHKVFIGYHKGIKTKDIIAPLQKIGAIDLSPFSNLDTYGCIGFSKSTSQKIITEALNKNTQIIWWEWVPDNQKCIDYVPTEEWGITTYDTTLFDTYFGIPKECIKSSAKLYQHNYLISINLNLISSKAIDSLLHKLPNIQYLRNNFNNHIQPQGMNDPYFNNDSQWHLKNKGIGGATIGEDINGVPVWNCFGITDKRGAGSYK